MNKKKYISYIFIILLLTFFLVGCKKMASIETKIVGAVIEDVHYSAAYAVPVYTGKVTTVRVQPATYKTYLLYNGTCFSVNGHNTYNYCKNHIGEIVDCVLEVITYKDNTIDYDIQTVLIPGV